MLTASIWRQRHCPSKRFSCSIINLNVLGPPKGSAKAIGDWLILYILEYGRYVQNMHHVQVYMGFNFCGLNHFRYLVMSF